MLFGVSSSFVALLLLALLLPGGQSRIAAACLTTAFAAAVLLLFKKRKSSALYFKKNPESVTIRDCMKSDCLTLLIQVTVFLKEIQISSLIQTLLSVLELSFARTKSAIFLWVAD